MRNFGIWLKTRQSLLCNAMGHPGWPNIRIITLQECTFELFLLTKTSAISQKNTTPEINYTYDEDYL